MNFESYLDLVAGSKLYASLVICQILQVYLDIQKHKRIDKLI